MEYVSIGKTKMELREFEKIIQEILDFVKKERRPYIVNKVILEKAIEKLDEEIIG